jgi:hypothetical protein
MRLYWSGLTLAPWHGWGNPPLAFEMVVSELYGAPGTPAVLVAAGVVLIAGAAGTAIRMRARAALILAPIAGVLAAALGGAYPLAPRLLLFAAPLFFLLVAEGLLLVTRPIGRRWGAATAGVLGGALAFTPANVSLRMALSPPGEGPREVARYLARQVQPGDTLYVGARTLQTWIYYSTDWTSPDRARLAWLTALAEAGGAAHENAPRRGREVRAGEGVGVEYAWRGAREIFGLPTGAQFLIGRLFSASPDLGFIENELRRLTSWRSGRLWIFHALDFERQDDQLSPDHRQLSRGRAHHAT